MDRMIEWNVSKPRRCVSGTWPNLINNVAINENKSTNHKRDGRSVEVIKVGRDSRSKWINNHIQVVRKGKVDRFLLFFTFSSASGGMKE